MQQQQQQRPKKPPQPSPLKDTKWHTYVKKLLELAPVEAESADASGVAPAAPAPPAPFLKHQNNGGYIDGKTGNASSSRRKPRYRLLRSLQHLPLRDSSPAKCNLFKLGPEELGAGTYGTVTEACLSIEECDGHRYPYAVKIVELRTPQERVEFLLEAAIAKFASERGYGVPVIHSFICNQGNEGVLIMRRLQSVRHSVLSLPQLMDFYDMVRRMHNDGILHCDLFLRNVLRDPARKNRLYIADFGLAFVMHDAVPNPLRVTDLVGFIAGEPQDFRNGIQPPSFAEQVYQIWRNLFQNDMAWLMGLKMRINRGVVSPAQYPTRAPYRGIDCVTYYSYILSNIALPYARKLGEKGLYSKTVWLNYCDEGDNEAVDNLAKDVLGVSGGGGGTTV